MLPNLAQIGYARANVGRNQGPKWLHVGHSWLQQGSMWSNPRQNWPIVCLLRPDLAAFSVVRAQSGRPNSGMELVSRIVSACLFASPCGLASWWRISFLGLRRGPQRCVHPRAACARSLFGVSQGPWAVVAVIRGVAGQARPPKPRLVRWRGRARGDQTRVGLP